MNLLRVLVSCAVLLSIVSCDAARNRELTRESARKLLENADLGKLSQLTFGFEALKCLNETGIISANMTGASVGPNGNGIIDSISFSSFDYSNSIDFSSPVNLSKVAVTGISSLSSESDGEQRRIEFNASIDFSKLANLRPDHARCFNSPAAGSGSAIAEKYDDGWRIVSVSAPKYEPPAVKPAPVDIVPVQVPNATAPEPDCPQVKIVLRAGITFPITSECPVLLDRSQMPSWRFDLANAEIKRKYPEDYRFVRVLNRFEGKRGWEEVKLVPNKAAFEEIGVAELEFVVSLPSNAAEN